MFHKSCLEIMLALTSSSNSYRRVANVLGQKTKKQFEWPPRIELEMRKRHPILYN